MPTDEFTPAEMQIIMLANERVSFALTLTNSEDHRVVRVQVSALIMECAEGGERDLQKLIDCAHAGLSRQL